MSARSLTLYAIAIAALVLKSQGAFWDVAYHFGHLRELTQAPHILNGLGNLVMIGVATYLWRTTPAERLGPVRWLVAGIALFMVAIPIDDTWHRLFGIDVTIWSPPHLLLYTGTALMVVGMGLKTESDWRAGLLTRTQRAVLLLVFSFLFFDYLWFLLMQHEHGVVVGDLMRRGLYHPDADIMELYEQGRGQIYGVAPGIGYPLWAAGFLLLCGRLLHWMDLPRFSFTIVVGLYLLDRTASLPLLTSLGYTLPALPLFLLPCAFVFDLVHRRTFLRSPVTDLLVAALTVVPLYGALLLLRPLGIPAFWFATMPMAVVAGWLGLQIAMLVAGFVGRTSNPRLASLVWC